MKLIRSYKTLIAGVADYADRGRYIMAFVTAIFVAVAAVFLLAAKIVISFAECWIIGIDKPRCDTRQKRFDERKAIR